MANFGNWKLTVNVLW